MSPPVREAWIETSASSPIYIPGWSPPVREAWIETYRWSLMCRFIRSSPPVREAWIETIYHKLRSKKPLVASRAGGVD